MSDDRPRSVGGDDFAETVNLVLPFAFKLKAKMQERHLRRARVKCPRPGCAGTVHASLNGRKGSRSSRVRCARVLGENA